MHQKADCTELGKVKEQLEMITTEIQPNGKKRQERPMGISGDVKISTSKCRSLSNINSLGRRQTGESLPEKRNPAQGWGKLKE